MTTAIRLSFLVMTIGVVVVLMSLVAELAVGGSVPVLMMVGGVVAWMTGTVGAIVCVVVVALGFFDSAWSDR